MVPPLVEEQPVGIVEPSLPRQQVENWLLRVLPQRVSQVHGGRPRPAASRRPGGGRLTTAGWLGAARADASRSRRNQGATIACCRKTCARTQCETHDLWHRAPRARLHHHDGRWPRLGVRAGQHAPGLMCGIPLWSCSRTLTLHSLHQPIVAAQASGLHARTGRRHRPACLPRSSRRRHNCPSSPSTSDSRKGSLWVQGAVLALMGSHSARMVVPVIARPRRSAGTARLPLGLLTFLQPAQDMAGSLTARGAGFPMQACRRPPLHRVRAGGPHCQSCTLGRTYTGVAAASQHHSLPAPLLSHGMPQASAPYRQPQARPPHGASPADGHCECVP